MDLWVFAYGSLIWNPGFAPSKQIRARLEGYRRSFCMRLLHYRGTAERPGLVLALEAQAGAACEGMALRLPAGGVAEILAALRARELISAAYHEVQVRISLADGREVTALTYVIAPGHEQHCTGLTAEEQAQIIAVARGERGPNRDYLHQTAEHLAALGIDDPDLAWLDRRVRALTGAEGT